MYIIIYTMYINLYIEILTLIILIKHLNISFTMLIIEGNNNYNC